MHPCLTWARHFGRRIRCSVTTRIVLRIQHPRFVQLCLRCSHALIGRFRAWRVRLCRQPGLLSLHIRWRRCYIARSAVHFAVPAVAAELLTGCGSLLALRPHIRCASRRMISRWRGAVQRSRSRRAAYHRTTAQSARNAGNLIGTWPCHSRPRRTQRSNREPHNMSHRVLPNYGRGLVGPLLGKLLVAIKVAALATLYTKRPISSRADNQLISFRLPPPISSHATSRLSRTAPPRPCSHALPAPDPRTAANRPSADRHS
jgi:hypothetical protein